MNDMSLGFESNIKKFVKGAKNRTGPHANFVMRFEGHNEDITESYYWIINFPYYTGKGYVTLKLEDNHYFSENSQYGGQVRQVKGGSIRAFYENFNQIIQLIKVHLMPLLKEVKQADFYHNWIKEIVDNDKIVQEAIEKKKANNENKEFVNAKAARDEAISHLKDEWVNKVEGGRMWAMSKSATEQGLDYSLLPQLFFGTNLENPLHGVHGNGKSIKNQLDEDIYKIDITEGAKEQIGRQIYKFYFWLPSAIRDTQVTYKLKLASLKNIYAQVQLSINLIKPILMEINKKGEKFNKNSFYYGNESENHEIINVFDSSYSFIRTLGIRDFGLPERGQKWKIKDLEIGDYGLFIDASKGELILQGNGKEKSGYIIGEEEKNYRFIPTDIEPDSMTPKKFEELKKNVIIIEKEHLKLFPIIELELTQKRRMETMSSPQGQQQVPFMKNQINFNSYAWDIYEIATYRESLKEENLDLIESFMDEIKAIKEDLLKYVHSYEPKPISLDTEKPKKEKNKEKADLTLITGPFKGIYDIFSPLIPNLSLPKTTKKNKKEGIESTTKKQRIIAELSCLEDAWKVYNIYKKSHQKISY
ncbi:MAG: hypothetical protein PF569_08960 [Candidatus Woesearchaeota archaeon]|jgi:hypothetical protein|nr:hypothetical protein [Candidatus Woesearchaeota archaeon]